MPRFLGTITYIDSDGAQHTLDTYDGLGFIVRVTVTIPSNNLTLTLSSASSLSSPWYKFVDWGDGNSSKFSNTHTYNTQGTYTCVFYGVTTIGTRAFYHCTSLTSVAIGSGVRSIGSSAFSGCTSLTSVTILDSVTSIGYEAFYGCTSLTSITISNSVTTIGTRAFYYCTSLTNVTIPDGVTSIGDQAFYHCTSLTSVAIGSGVTSIGNEAFYYCTNLKSITIPPVSSSPTTTIGTNVFTVPSGSSLRNGQIYYAGSEEIDENSAWNGKLPGDFTINYNCTPIDLSKYTIIKTTDQSVQGSDGVIVLTVG